MTLRHISSRELAKPKTYFLGVDLGQAQDYTAITVLEREEHDTGKWVTDSFAQIYYGSLGGDFTKPFMRTTSLHVILSGYLRAHPTRRRLRALKSCTTG